MILQDLSPAMSCSWLVNFQFFSVHFPRLTESNFVSEGKKRVDFVDSETCLLIVMLMGCSKKRNCLCSPARLCNSRTALVPIHSPFYLFPQLMTSLPGCVWAASLFRNRTPCQFFLFFPWHPLVLPCSLIRQRWAISPLHTRLGWL